MARTTKDRIDDIVSNLLGWVETLEAERVEMESQRDDMARMVQKLEAKIDGLQEALDDLSEAKGESDA